MNRIPKKIHYCWFGGSSKPEIVVRCIESWKRFMPDYELYEWNEENYDCHKVPFIDEAYRMKKWAFVSDYVRFDVLNQYGGIYFDTDVELLKPIPEDILDKGAFTGMESAGQVSPGLIFAITPCHPFLKEIMASYQKTHFMIDGKPNYKTVNEFTTELLIPKGLEMRNIYQEVDGISIYPPEYFCGYDQDIKEYDIREETISVHHYAGTWMKKGIKQKMQLLCKKVLGINLYRKLLGLKRKIFGISNK